MSGGDLFGNPVREGKGGKGRPAFQPTEGDRNKIKLLLALGWNDERIAEALGISRATLHRHFRDCLKIRLAARSMLDAERLAIAWREAAKGNVGALKEFGRMVERNDLMSAEAVLQARQAAAKMRGKDQAEADARDADAPKRPLGKKEAAQAAAEEPAGGEWGSDLDPPPGLFATH